MTDGQRKGLLLAALQAQGSTLLGKGEQSQHDDLFPLLVGQVFYAPDGSVLCALDIETRKLITAAQIEAEQTPLSIAFRPQHHDGAPVWPTDVVYQDNGESKRPETWRPMADGVAKVPTKVVGKKGTKSRGTVPVPITPDWLDAEWRAAERAKVNRTAQALRSLLGKRDPDGLWKVATGKLPECGGVYGISVRYRRDMTDAEKVKRDAELAETAEKVDDVLALADAKDADEKPEQPTPSKRNHNRKVA